MRVKSQWFRAGREHTPQELAGAVAFNVWRIGLQVLNNMRRAGFEIEAGPQYFSFLAECLVFLIQIADRIAFRHLEDDARATFTSTLANRVAENLADNHAELLGGDRAGYKADFIDRLNACAEEYAHYEYEKVGENFSFIRTLGLFLQDVMDEQDRHWVTDQVMAIEAPEAISTLERAMSGLLELESRPSGRQSGTSGE